MDLLALTRIHPQLNRGLQTESQIHYPELLGFEAKILR
jgi:hypothetical protein